jgi:DNA-nicking Smr family endonuclease
VRRPAPPGSADPPHKKTIARGNRAIDGRLDLHGMTQAEAHDALFRFLRAKQARGAKVVLVITGKGTRGNDDGGGRGCPQTHGSRCGLACRISAG